jgi:hypothetical protein
LSPEDEGIIVRKAQYDNEELIVDGLQNELNRTKDLVDGLNSEVATGGRDGEELRFRMRTWSGAFAEVCG